LGVPVDIGRECFAMDASYRASVLETADESSGES
jgi:hypothetical protein